MKEMFGSMMQGVFSNMPKEDRQKIKACFERMVEMCPCCNMKDMSEEKKTSASEKENPS